MTVVRKRNKRGGVGNGPWLEGLMVILGLRSVYLPIYLRQGRSPHQLANQRMSVLANVVLRRIDA